MKFKDTSDDDHIHGTSGADVFDMGQGGEDTVKSFAGDDVFNFGTAFNAGDTIN